MTCLICTQSLLVAKFTCARRDREIFALIAKFSLYFSTSQFPWAVKAGPDGAFYVTCDESYKVC